MLLAGAFALLAAAQMTPSCVTAGRSVDQDPRGLNVRAVPSPSGRIVGRLYSVLDPEALHHGSRERYGPLFYVREVSGGWLRIDGAAAESEGADGEVRRNYTGPGWVSAALVEPIIVSMRTGDPGTRGYAGPAFSAAVLDPDGLTNIERMRTVRRHARIVACDGVWVQLEYVRSGRLVDGRWVDFAPAERRTARAWFRSGEPGE